MNELILLGAGASIEAGVPGSFEMTRKILNYFKKKRMEGKYFHVMSFAIGGLLFQRGVNGEDPYEGANIEDVFNAIQHLGERTSLEAAPFISAWHPLIEQLDIIKPKFTDNSTKVFKDLNRFSLELRELIGGRDRSDEIAAILERIISHHNTSFDSRDQKSPIPGRGAIFKRTNEYMLRKLINFTFINDVKKVEYLFPLAETLRIPTTSIVTLNYDNTIELACKEINVTVNTGISEWSESGRFPDSIKDYNLLKLHGSIDWCLEERDPTPQKPLSSQAIHQASKDQIDKKDFQPAIIFGHRNKLTTKGPFLDMLRVFQERLKEVNLLTIIGYSFGDSHVNEYIKQWLNSNSKGMIRIANGKYFQTPDSGLASQILQIQDRVGLYKMDASEAIIKFFSKKIV